MALFSRRKILSHQLDNLATRPPRVLRYTKLAPRLPRAQQVPRRLIDRVAANPPATLPLPRTAIGVSPADSTRVFSVAVLPVPEPTVHAIAMETADPINTRSIATPGAMNLVQPRDGRENRTWEDSPTMDPLLRLLPLLLPRPFVDPTKLPDPPPKPHQIEGAKWLVDIEAGLLADEQGMGKTVTTILALKILFQRGQIRKALIICPKAALGSAARYMKGKDPQGWDDHLAQWAPELLVSTVTSDPWVGGVPPAGFTGDSARDRARNWDFPAHVYLITEALLANDYKAGQLAGRASDFDCVIVDEIQSIKNPKALRSHAVKSFRPHTTYRWGLSGTPMQNNPRELLSIFDFIEPVAFAGINQGTIDDIPQQTLRDRMRPYLKRRHRDPSEIPTKNRQPPVWVELDPEHYRIYLQQYESKRRAIQASIPRGRTIDDLSVTEKFRVHQRIVGATQSLKQVCNFAPGQSSSRKVEALGQILGQALAENRKVIVYSQYLTEGIEKLAPHLEHYGCLQYTGGLSHAERQDVINRFQDDPELRILLGSVRAAGIAINLVEASVIVHFDHWWNPAVMWQAEDRACRYGQKREVDVYSLWVTGTIEEKIKATLERKETLIRAIVDELGEDQSSDDIDKRLTLQDWLAIFDV